MASQFSLANPPLDGITRVRFGHKMDGVCRLMATSWDKSVHVYAIDSLESSSKKLDSFEVSDGSPVLDGVWGESDHSVYAGTCRGSLVQIDLEKRKETRIGTHEKGVKSIVRVGATLVASGSWDKTVRVWDGRVGPLRAVSRFDLMGKVFDMTLCGNDTLLAGCSGTTVYSIHFKNGGDSPSPSSSRSVQSRQSSLKHQLRAIVGHPNGTQFVCSSIEGRVSVDYLDLDPSIQSQKYAFKCHRVQSVIYPVNSIAFHSKWMTFATGGSDGHVNLWDPLNKKRISQFPAFETTVSSIDFGNVPGQDHLLAIAQSYSWENGPIQKKSNDAIFIRKTKEHEVKPRASKRKQVPK